MSAAGFLVVFGWSLLAAGAWAAALGFSRGFSRIGRGFFLVWVLVSLGIWVTSDFRVAGLGRKSKGKCHPAHGWRRLLVTEALEDRILIKYTQRQTYSRWRIKAQVWPDSRMLRLRTVRRRQVKETCCKRSRLSSNRSLSVAKRPLQKKLD